MSKDKKVKIVCGVLVFFTVALVIGGLTHLGISICWSQLFYQTNFGIKNTTNPQKSHVSFYSVHVKKFQTLSVSTSLPTLLASAKLDITSLGWLFTDRKV